MADLMKNPTKWRKREIERLTVANTLRKHWINVERQKADLITYTRNLRMQQI